MRVTLLLHMFVAPALAFAPAVKTAESLTTATSTMLLHAVNRRDVVDLLTGGAILGCTPGLASAKAASTFFYDDQIENVREESQMYTGGKLDLNSAFVVSACIQPRKLGTIYESWPICFIALRTILSAASVKPIHLSDSTQH